MCYRELTLEVEGPSCMLQGINPRSEGTFLCVVLCNTSKHIIKYIMYQHFTIYFVQSVILHLKNMIKYIIYIQIRIYLMSVLQVVLLKMIRCLTMIY